MSMNMEENPQTVDSTTKTVDLRARRLRGWCLCSDCRIFGAYGESEMELPFSVTTAPANGPASVLTSVIFEQTSAPI